MVKKKCTCTHPDLYGISYCSSRPALSKRTPVASGTAGQQSRKQRAFVLREPDAFIGGGQLVPMCMRTSAGLCGWVNGTKKCDMQIKTSSLVAEMVHQKCLLRLQQGLRVQKCLKWSCGSSLLGSNGGCWCSGVAVKMWMRLGRSRGCGSSWYWNNGY